MLLFGVTPNRCSTKCSIKDKTKLLPRKTPIFFAYTRQPITATVAAFAAAGLVFSAGAIEVSAPALPEETLSNIPQTLDSVCSPEQNCMKRYKIQRPKSRKAETCTGKCVTTCIQGGFGSPGEGPFNIRRYQIAVWFCDTVYGFIVLSVGLLFWPYPYSHDHDLQ